MDTRQSERLIEHVFLFGLPPQPIQEPNLLAHAHHGIALSRAPKQDYPERKFSPDALHMFVFPRDISIRASPLSRPIFHSFVMTEEDGRRMYGFCCTRYHRVAEHSDPTGVRLTVQQLCGADRHQFPAALFVPYCLCVLSYWPFHQSFIKCLAIFVDEVLTPDAIPLEAPEQLYKLLQRRAPQRGLGPVTVSLGRREVYFAVPDQNALPMADVEFRPLFRSLEPRLVVQCITALLLERPVVVISASVGLLTPVMEALLILLYPLSWPFVYIPLLPKALTDFLQAPMPFFVGTIREFIADVQLSDHVVIVDLDRNTVMTGQELLPLPMRHVMRLYNIITESAPLFAHHHPSWTNSSTTEKSVTQQSGPANTGFFHAIGLGAIGKSESGKAKNQARGKNPVVDLGSVRTLNVLYSSSEEEEDEDQDELTAESMRSPRISLDDDLLNFTEMSRGSISTFEATGTTVSTDVSQLNAPFSPRYRHADILLTPYAVRSKPTHVPSPRNASSAANSGGSTTPPNRLPSVSSFGALPADISISNLSLPSTRRRTRARLPPLTESTSLNSSLNQQNSDGHSPLARHDTDSDWADSVSVSLSQISASSAGDTESQRAAFLRACALKNYTITASCLAVMRTRFANKLGELRSSAQEGRNFASWGSQEMQQLASYDPISRMVMVSACYQFLELYLIKDATRLVTLGILNTTECGQVFAQILRAEFVQAFDSVDELKFELCMNWFRDIVSETVVGFETPAPTAEPPVSVKRLRNGFLYVFVSLFKNFSQFFDVKKLKDSRKLEEAFDKEGFLAESSDDVVPFLRTFVDTQIFMYFLQERFTVTAEDKFESTVRRKMERKAFRLKLMERQKKTGELYCASMAKPNDWKRRHCVLEGSEFFVFKKVDSLHQIEVELKRLQTAKICATAADSAQADKKIQSLKEQLKQIWEDALKFRLHLVPNSTQISIPLNQRGQSPTPFVFEIRTEKIQIRCCTEDSNIRREWIQSIKAKIASDKDYLYGKFLDADALRTLQSLRIKDENLQQFLQFSQRTLRKESAVLDTLSQHNSPERGWRKELGASMIGSQLDANLSLEALRRRLQYVHQQVATDAMDKTELLTELTVLGSELDEIILKAKA
eukprot:GILK01009234.1.p1 GENE.GILK01009234.1~~GILK01009234.1.p1  ORF type:complete len:1163 (-),score=242.75 GILK01009234.1:371-3733(-)